MRSVALYLSILLLVGCNSPSPSAPTASPSASPAVAPTSAADPQVTIITPTPSEYPGEPPEDSAQLVSFFNEIYLGSRQGDFLVLLSAGDFVGLDCIKRGNPAFSTGSNSSMTNMEEQMQKIVSENPEFKEPISRVIDSYIDGSYEVKGDKDPLQRKEEFIETLKAVRAKLK